MKLGYALGAKWLMPHLYRIVLASQNVMKKDQKYPIILMTPWLILILYPSGKNMAGCLYVRNVEKNIQ